MCPRPRGGGARSPGARVPAAAALGVAQDRLVEKAFLNGLGIATASYVAVDGDDDLLAGLATFGSGVLRRGEWGMTGRASASHRDAAPQEVAGAHAALGGVPLILESLVPFVREISIVAARGRRRLRRLRSGRERSP